MKGIRAALLLTAALLIFFSAVCGCAGAHGASGSGVNPQNTSAKSSLTGYENRLFDSSHVHAVDIAISGKDWAKLLKDPLAKKKFRVSVTIDGERFKDVSFSTKGRYSLRSVADDTKSIRYSFKVVFDKYNRDQSYYGLCDLLLNNNTADATSMKDYLSYGIFRRTQVPAPLCSYVWLTINGRDHGLYLAVEDIGPSFLERTSKGPGMLYKPEAKDLPAHNEKQPGNTVSYPAHRGADLVYTDDNIDSYSDIFDNAETKADKEDRQRVIAALKLLSGGKADLCVDTDEVIRYFAAHNFVLNYDSYTGIMLHNYYLYENNGILSMFPWDYNQAFGGGVERGTVTSDATELLNSGIDTPLSDTTADARPMWKWIVSCSRYLKAYHDVFDALVGSYFESGEFCREIDALYQMLLPYVEKDPTAFYTAEEFKTAYRTIREFCLLRAKSIRLQLEGKLSSSSRGQKASERVDCSALCVRDMGTIEQ
ncbi:MAG: CotH kinase family protein [Synergistes sp.]|nr:CotH kinase family protein [Synergistes sp.]